MAFLCGWHRYSLEWKLQFWQWAYERLLWSGCVYACLIARVCAYACRFICVSVCSCKSVSVRLIKTP